MIMNSSAQSIGDTPEREMRHIPVYDLPHILSSYLRPIDMQANLLNSRKKTVSDGLHEVRLLRLCRRGA